MRIIAGKANRRQLDTLPGEEITRPTSDRAKEGLFSAIQFSIAGKRVLDLFAGCGALGLEAISRGAESAVLIDSSADAFEIIKKNARNTGLIKQCRISRMDYSEFLKSAATKSEQFDIIFLDPPYAKDMKNEILKKVTRSGIISDEALIVCETDNDCFDGRGIYGLDFVKTYKYGKTFITILKKATDVEGETNE